MRETTLVKHLLTPDMIAAGEAIVRHFDETRIPIVAAFWMYQDEADMWRLVLASPVVARRSSVPLIDELQDWLEATGEQRIQSWDVFFRGPDYPDVEHYATTIHGKPRGNEIYHINRGDAYIYRYIHRPIR